MGCTVTHRSSRPAGYPDSDTVKTASDLPKQYSHASGWCTLLPMAAWHVVCVGDQGAQAGKGRGPRGGGGGRRPSPAAGLGRTKGFASASSLLQRVVPSRAVEPTRRARLRLCPWVWRDDRSPEHPKSDHNHLRDPTVVRIWPGVLSGSGGTDSDPPGPRPPTSARPSTRRQIRACFNRVRVGRVHSESRPLAHHGVAVLGCWSRSWPPGRLCQARTAGGLAPHVARGAWRLGPLQMTVAWPSDAAVLHAGCSV
jgi:hypothetical protein